MKPIRIYLSPDDYPALHAALRALEDAREDVSLPTSIQADRIKAAEEVLATELARLDSLPLDKAS